MESTWRERELWERTGQKSTWLEREQRTSTWRVHVPSERAAGFSQRGRSGGGAAGKSKTREGAGLGRRVLGGSGYCQRMRRVWRRIRGQRGRSERRFCRSEQGGTGHYGRAAGLGGRRWARRARRERAR